MAKAAKKPGKAAPAEGAERKEAAMSPRLETNIDRFYRLVKDKKSISFLDAAKEQGTSREQIASWARILEEHKLARVHYPVFGAPVILIEAEKLKKILEKEEGEKKPRKKVPKIAIGLGGGLMVLFGYVMVVNNPSNIMLREQMTALAQRAGAVFWFLPYPLNIITPIIIIVAALFAVLRFRKMRAKGERKGPKEEKKQKQSKPKKEKKSKDDLEDKLSRIKEDLRS
jgi:hypothetical protein